MAKRQWTVQLEDGIHTIELDHKYWSGKRLITVDGAVVYEGRQTFIDFGSTHPINVAGKPGFIRIETNGLTFSYDAAVGGRSLTTGKEVAEPLPTPWWGWIFVLANALIVVLGVGGLFPILIGWQGGYQSYRISRRADWGPLARIAAGTGITVLAWALYLLTVLLGNIVKTQMG